MFCTNCGKQNEEDMAFCIHCGSPMPQAEQPAAYCTNCGEQLREDDDFCIHCGFGRQPVEPEPPRCPGCGAPVEPGVRFCIRCGTSLQSPARTATAQALPARPSFTGLHLLIFCLPQLLSILANFVCWNLHNESWFIYSCDDDFFAVIAISSWIMPAICLWAGMSKNNQRKKCRTALVFTILDMIMPLALLGMIISEEPHTLSRNLPYMALCLSRNITAILALFLNLKRVK